MASRRLVDVTGCSKGNCFGSPSHLEKTASQNWGKDGRALLVGAVISLEGVIHYPQSNHEGASVPALAFLACRFWACLVLAIPPFENTVERRQVGVRAARRRHTSRNRWLAQSGLTPRYRRGEGQAQ